MLRDTQKSYRYPGWPRLWSNSSHCCRQQPLRGERRVTGWSVTEGRFLKNAVPAEKVGLVTPRAFRVMIPSKSRRLPRSFGKQPGRNRDWFIAKISWGHPVIESCAWDERLDECSARDPWRKAEGPPNERRRSWMPGRPCIKEKGVRGIRTLVEGGPTRGQNPLWTTAGSEVEPERRNWRGVRPRKTQDAKLRPTRPPRTSWHTVIVHV